MMRWRSKVKCASVVKLWVKVEIAGAEVGQQAQQVLEE